MLTSAELLAALMNGETLERLNDESYHVATYNVRANTFFERWLGGEAASLDRDGERELMGDIVRHPTRFRIVGRENAESSFYDWANKGPEPTSSVLASPGIEPEEPCEICGQTEPHPSIDAVCQPAKKPDPAPDAGLDGEAERLWRAFFEHGRPSAKKAKTWANLADDYKRMHLNVAREARRMYGAEADSMRELFDTENAAHERTLKETERLKERVRELEEAEAETADERDAATVKLCRANETISNLIAETDERRRLILHQEQLLSDPKVALDLWQLLARGELELVEEEGAKAEPEEGDFDARVASNWKVRTLWRCVEGLEQKLNESGASIESRLATLERRMGE